MTIPAILVANPLDFDFTFEACASREQQPIYVGATVSIRFQLRDDTDTAVSLTSSTIEMIFSTEEITVVRSSANLISGSTYEIKADANQLTEVGDTGTGWYQANFLPAETAMIPMIGVRRGYKTKVALGDGTVIYPHFLGKVDIGN